MDEKAQKRAYYLKHREEYLERSRKKRLENPKEVGKYQRNYRLKNHEHLKQYHSKWARRNRDIVNNHHIKHNEVHASELNMSLSNYKTQILYWTRRIRKLFNYTCQVCGGKATVSHHLIYLKTEPKLTFNTNNGMALCSECHDEVHQRNINI